MEFIAMNKDVQTHGETVQKNVNGAGKSLSQNGKTSPVVLNPVPQPIMVCNSRSSTTRDVRRLNDETTVPTMRSIFLWQMPSKTRRCRMLSQVLS